MNIDEIKREITGAVGKGFARQNNIFARQDHAAELSPIFGNRILNFTRFLDNSGNEDIAVSLKMDLKLFDGKSDIAKDDNTLLSIYEKYTSLCPAPDGLPRVSYYQKKKFDMAIESAGGDGNMAYVMLEVTGIFDHMFNVRQPDGALKRLRGRSYTCILIIKAVALVILNELKLPKCNLLDDGGELAGILIRKADIRKVSDLITMVKTDLVNKFNGSINLLYAIKDDVRKDDLLVNSEALLNELNEGLFSNEYQQFNDISELLSDKTLRIKTNVQTCKYCGRDFDCHGDKTNEMCQLCQNEKVIGTNVAKAKYLISIYNSATPLLDEAGCAISFFNKKVVYIFCKTECEVLTCLQEIKQPVDVASINSTKYCSSALGEQVSLSFITIGNAAPMEEKNNNNIKELDDIGKEAAGAEYLGVVEMDSDNFGQVTSCARSSTGYALNNLAEVATLSSYFKYFFQAYLETKIEEHNGYTIYAGGDDLFLVGPWNEMIALTRKINKDLRIFTGQNERLTLSCGITIITGNATVVTMSGLVKDELKKAKKDKDNISVFGKAYKWAKLDDLFCLIYALFIDVTPDRKFEYKNNITNNLIYDLMSLTRKIKNKDDITIIPKIIYRMREHYELISHDNEMGVALNDYLVALMPNKSEDEDSSHSGNDIYDFKCFHFIANYCALITRSKKEELK